MAIGHGPAEIDNDLERPRTPNTPSSPAPSRAVSLRVKGSLVTMLVLVLSLGLSTVIEYVHHRERALSNMSLMASQTGQVIESALQIDMLLSDFERIQHTFDDIAKDNRIRTLYLLDPTGRVVFAPNQEGVGQKLDNQNVSCQPFHHLPPAERPSGIVVTDAEGATVFRSMHPIENLPEFMSCHNSGQRRNGLLLTVLSIQPVEAALAD